ncbi:MAG: hypothetical protein MJY84_03485 [Bacteroidales bacterium]|nr:hypothetical protein [Bacteroidales bacterium]
MDNRDNETIHFDCSRGCSVTKNPESGETECEYRQGCCKLADFNWFEGVTQAQYKDIFEVRFKNTRKDFYVNNSGQTIKTGDLVIVEAANGHDLGIVVLEGPAVGRQLKCKGISPEETQLKKIYRKAKQFDIEKWQEAIAREQDTMIQARRIAAELGLDMKVGDVEFQGDGTKAIFYYIADGRVDFRQLIKVYAEAFHLRIEMKQIGARQAPGLIGGLAICGRELCCANYITNFQSISTSAARIQDLSLNPQKLAGQCGKLKCCLNYEVANYADAHSRIPSVKEPLEFEDGPAYLAKVDILQETLYFTYEKGSLANLIPLSASEVREIQMMNRNGERPESLLPDIEPDAPEFVSAVGDDSITRFDKPKKSRNRSRGKNNRGRSGDKPARNDEGQAREEHSSEPRQGRGDRQGRHRNNHGGERRKPHAPRQEDAPQTASDKNQEG